MQLRASLFVVEFKDAGVAELCGFTLYSWFFILVADGGYRLQGELIIGCGFALIPCGDVMSLLLG